MSSRSHLWCLCDVSAKFPTWEWDQLNEYCGLLLSYPTGKLRQAHYFSRVSWSCSKCYDAILEALTGKWKLISIWSHSAPVERKIQTQLTSGVWRWAFSYWWWEFTVCQSAPEEWAVHNLVYSCCPMMHWSWMEIAHWLSLDAETRQRSAAGAFLGFENCLFSPILSSPSSTPLGPGQRQQTP